MFDIDSYLRDFLELVSDDHPLQKDWDNVREQMIVHTRGVFPEKLVKKTRPNEPEDIQQYREDIWEPVTTDPINRAIDSLVRTVVNSNYNITYPKKLGEYLQEKKFTAITKRGMLESLSFIQYIEKVVFRIDIDDPNGALTWFPVNADDALLPPSENPPDKEVDISPIYVPSSRIMDVTREVFAFEHDKKIVIEEQKFPAYYIMTKKAIYYYYPIRLDEKNEPVYTSQIWYEISSELSDENALDEVPVIVLGGEIVENDEGYLYYHSFFQGFIAPGNDCLRSKTDDDAVRVRMNFPIIEEKGQLCKECSGAGLVTDKEGKKKVKCDGCGGRGAVVSKGPYSTYVIEPPKSNEEPGFAERPAVAFRHPEIGILEHSNKTWRQFKKDAETSVNLTYIDEAQSGKAKEIDREQKYDKLFKISKNLFGNIILRSLNLIDAYLNPIKSDRKSSTVIEPTNFQIKTANDLIEEVTELKKGEAPAHLILSAIETLNQRLYSGDPTKLKISNILIVWDSLLTYTADEINSLKATTVTAVTDRELVKHINGSSILYELSLDENFLTKKPEKILEEADVKLDELIAKRGPQIPIGQPEV